MRHILSVEPEFIKLDMSITRGIDTDRKRRALASALVAFAHETRANIIAEGVETDLPQSSKLPQHAAEACSQRL